MINTYPEIKCISFKFKNKILFSRNIPDNAQNKKDKKPPIFAKKLIFGDTIFILIDNINLNNF